jgi:hypothetical protein
MATYLTAVRTALANLLGEDSVSTTWPVVRDNAIQWSLERIARMYDFDFGRTSASLVTNTSGTVALPTTTFRTDPSLDVRVTITGPANDYIFDEVREEDFDSYPQGSYRYYISTDGTGQQTLVTTEPSTTLTVTGQRAVPTISDSTPSNFPSALAIAKGALIYVREYEDKDADISVDDAKFMQIMQEVIGAEQRSHGSRRAITRAELLGRYTGQVGSDVGGNSWR